MNQTTDRRTAWWLLPLLAAGVSAGACGRGLFGISSSENQDGGGVDRVPDNRVPAGLSVCFPDHPSFCDETCRQATQVLWDSCATCHSNRSGNSPLGLPPWDFVMDPQRLTTETWKREGQSAIPFVLPGDPAHSAVYMRAVITKDMPPKQYDLSQPSYPRVGEADGRILNDWIAGCLGASPVDAAVPPSRPDGATDRFLSDPGPVACPAEPSTGACPVEHQNCLYPTTSCLCVGGNWECVHCPGTQPVIGSSCAAYSIPDEGALALRCGYGAVTCSCDNRDFESTWGCGVCPVSRPGDGTACGNASFSCAYGSDTCSCAGNNWSCLSGLHCPDPVTTYGYGPPWVQCRGLTACDYPSQGQSCACRPQGQWDCSCPPALPTEGSACAPVFSNTCAYSDQSCSCGSTGNGWHCTAVCPTARPIVGDACNSALSCSYDGGLCYCDGSHWQCS